MACRPGILLFVEHSAHGPRADLHGDGVRPLEPDTVTGARPRGGPRRLPFDQADEDPTSPALRYDAAWNGRFIPLIDDGPRPVPALDDEGQAGRVEHDRRTRAAVLGDLGEPGERAVERRSEAGEPHPRRQRTRRRGNAVTADLDRAPQSPAGKAGGRTASAVASDVSPATSITSRPP